MQGTVAAVAERHEVLLVIGTALSGGFDVVGNGCFGELPMTPTQNAEWMPGQERLAHLAPSVSVAFVRLRIPLMAFVGSRSLFRMLGAVPPVGEMWTAWMAARSLGLVGHALISFGQKESPGGIPELCSCLSLMVG
jgi:hypothetical protein